MQGRGAVQGRLQSHGRIGLQPFDGDIVGLRRALDVLKGGVLLGRSRHQQLATDQMGNAMALAEGVQQFLAAHTQTRLEGAGLVVQAGMDDFAVA